MLQETLMMEKEEEIFVHKKWLIVAKRNAMVTMFYGMCYDKQLEV